MQRQAFGRKVGAEAGGEIAVDLDGVEMPGACDQRRGQRGEAGTDLDQVVSRRGRDRGDDPRDVMRIDEEVLAEALAGLVTLHVSGAARVARR